MYNCHDCYDNANRYQRGHQRACLSRVGAVSEPCDYSGRKIARGLMVGIGGLALMLAVESGVLDFRSEQAEKTVVGVGLAGILGGGVGVAAGSLDRLLKRR